MLTSSPRIRRVFQRLQLLCESRSVRALREAAKKYHATYDGRVIGPHGERALHIRYRGRRGNYAAFSCYLSDGKFHCVEVHRLVAYQKFGEDMFKRGQVVRHLNSNSLDNSFPNIGIGTRKEDSADKSREARRRGAKAAIAPRRLLTTRQVEVMRRMAASDASVTAQQLGKLFGLPARRIERILDGRYYDDAPGPLKPRFTLCDSTI